MEIAELLGVTKQRAHQDRRRAWIPHAGQTTRLGPIVEPERGQGMGEGLAPGAVLALRQPRHHVPREEREDRQYDDDDCRVLDCRVPHEGVRLRLLDRILLVGQLSAPPFSCSHDADCEQLIGSDVVELKGLGCRAACLALPFMKMR